MQEKEIEIVQYTEEDFNQLNNQIEECDNDIYIPTLFYTIF